MGDALYWQADQIVQDKRLALSKRHAHQRGTQHRGREQTVRFPGFAALAC